MSPLPPLRRKIQRAFSVLVAAYAVLGALLVIAVITATGTSPRLIHKNYDSIAVSTQMKEAWSALDDPGRYSEKTVAQWQEQFEKALRFEEGNITEPGEKEAAERIRALWSQYRAAGGRAERSAFLELRERLMTLDRLNEKAMFELAQGSTHLSRMVLIGAIAYFIVTLVLAIFFADSLASRLAGPLKAIAETLHERPPFGGKLRFPEPSSLELMILSDEIKRLWQSASETKALNIAEIIAEKGKLETLLESVEDALLVVDEEGRVTHCNARLLEMIGLPLGSVIGQVWTDLPSMGENYIKLRGVLRSGVEEGHPVDLAWNSEVRNFAARWKRIAGIGGRSAGSLFLLHDITERRQRERMRAEVIDLLSHELKTPLQSLGTASEILCQRREALPEDLRLLVETVSEDYERIRAVANEFVQVTQPLAKILKLKLEKVPVNQVLADWLKPFRVVAKDRGVTIDLVREGSELIYAQIDTVKFPWVISNLVSNAIRFSPKGSTVTIKITDREGAVEIKVKDEGPGVPEEDRVRIFEPFYQAKMPTWDGTRGLFGVGLTIAKEVVEAHDGQLEYYPNQPQGSVFRIRLPFPELDLG